MTTQVHEVDRFAMQIKDTISINIRSGLSIVDH
jgi:hypothetical protein